MAHGGNVGDILRLGDRRYHLKGNTYQPWNLSYPFYGIVVRARSALIYGIQSLLSSSSFTELIGIAPNGSDKRELILEDDEQVIRVMISHYKYGMLASFTIITDRQVFGPIGTVDRARAIKTATYDFNPGTFAGLFGYTRVFNDVDGIKRTFIASIGVFKHSSESMIGHAGCRPRSLDAGLRVSGPVECLDDKLYHKSGSTYSRWEIPKPFYSIKVRVKKHVIFGIRALKPSANLSTFCTEHHGSAPEGSDYRELALGPDEKVIQVSITHYDYGSLASFTITTNRQVFGPIGTPDTTQGCKTTIYDFKTAIFAGLFGYTRTFPSGGKHGSRNQIIASIGVMSKRVEGIGYTKCVCKEI